MTRKFHLFFVPILLLGILWSNCLDTQSSQGSARSSYSGWYAYGGDAGGTRYAQFDQVNRINVQRLERVWTYRTGELGQGSPVKEKLTFEATPILFDDTLYFSTAFGKVIALDPETGKECWVYDPEVDRTKRYSEVTSRGVSAWHDAEVKNSRAGRIFIGTIDARLIAIDAATGAPCQDFGDNGQVDLTEGLDVKSRIDYQVTSPPAVLNDVVVVGSSIGDNWHADTGQGTVRAFDARTGALRWAWNPLPSDEENTGPVGGANAWSIISADPDRNLVFVPTSSPSPDFYGGLRPGNNRYANSVVALRASTGEVVWHFQTVHHDLWDYDIAAQPALVTITHDGQRIPAVAQATKMGSLFLLHRETGQPVFPVEERPVPQTDVPGERTWETQPFSTLPLLMPQGPLTADDAWGLTDTEREENREVMGKHRSDGIFTPPSLEGTIMYPGNAAGTNWGSVAFDPERQLLVANTSRIATLVQLIPRGSFDKARREEGNFEFGAQREAPYGMKRKTIFITPPPWGTLAAVDLSSGEMRWEVPIGEANGQTIGLPNAGGPMITAGGLIFLGATTDSMFRAFDIDTGEVLWRTELPLSAIATPMSYELDEKQYIVIAVGGHGKMGLPTGDYVMAFALP